VFGRMYREALFPLVFFPGDKQPVISASGAQVGRVIECASRTVDPQALPWDSRAKQKLTEGAAIIL